MKKVVIITGASSGIGYETAVYLSQKDFVVVLVARNMEKLVNVEQEILQLGGHAVHIPTDVSNPVEFQRMVERVIAEYGHIDILINNAGMMPLSLIKDGNLREWNLAVDVNIKGVINGISLVLPHMRSKNEGIIINIGSTAGYEIPPFGVVYSATKHAVKAITEGLYKELAMEKSNIRVAYFSPGPVDTHLINNSNAPEIVEFFSHAKVNKFPPNYIAESIYHIIENNSLNKYTNVTLYP